MENSNNTKPVPEAEPKNNSEPQEQEQGETPNQSSLTGDGGGSGGVADEALPPPLQQQSSRRTPFTNLSQVDADLALARALQEQERAYMMLRMGNDGSEYGSWDAGSYLHDEEDEDDDDDSFGDPDHDHGNGGDEDDTDVDDRNDVDAFDAHAHAEAGIDEDEDEDDDDEDGDDEEEDDNPGVEFDPALFSSDEAYARALQDAEEREMASRLFALAGLHDIAGEAEDMDEHGGNSQDTWEEVDPDELSYEELLALGEVVGTESRGLSADKIALLPSIKYKAGSIQSGSNDSCVICRLDYEEDEALTLLSCKHSYHSECINNWLKINKVCPVCSAEVSTSGHS